MDRNEADAIASLFERLAAAERQNPQRDREAEALIRQKIAAQPAAPYYLAQTVIVQQQALEAAQDRIAELESRAASRGSVDRRGPFLGRTPPPVYDRPQPWGSASGGFLAGAAQTAMGVAGGVLLGNLLAGSLFGGFGAHAHDYTDVDHAGDGDNGGHDDTGHDNTGNDDGGDFGGADAGGGDFA